MNEATLWDAPKSIKSIILKHETKVDNYANKLQEFFDYEFKGEIKTVIPDLPELPNDFTLGVIVGPSGSGKTTLLKKFNIQKNIEWHENKSVISHFDTPEQAIKKFSAVGFNSIPQMLLPYRLLSNGEKFRVDLSRQLHDNAVIDEFSSVVNRDVAFSTSNAFRKYITRTGLKNIIIASCHYDILEWLQPDWIFDTSESVFYTGRYLQRPNIHLDIFRTDTKIWHLFKKYHYLNNEISIASHCYAGIWKNNLVAFCAVMRYPSGTVLNGWREHRTVVLPDFQGLGIGNLFANSIAEMYVKNGGRYFSRTAHPSMGNYREQSKLWKATSKNRKLRKDIKNINPYNNHFADNKRICWSHEYIGATATTNV